MVLVVLVGADHETTSVTDIETTDPEDDVLGNVGGVVGDAFEVAGGKNELEARAHQRGLFGHVQEELFENAIAVLIDDIIAFEHLRGHLGVAENERTETLADHGAHRRRRHEPRARCHR